jgi:quercetin dioxygenase-like cupin family protein
MRSKSKRLLLITLVASSVVLWRAGTDRDVAVAQGRKPMVITRIFTGPDGLAHAEDIEMKLNARGATEMLKATGAEFSVRPPTPGASASNTGAASASDPGWHTGPARQFVITLSGNSEVEVSGGVHVLAGPGHINLIEDTTGKGHITRNFGPEDRIALTIPLADGVVIEGTRKPRTR